MMESSMKSSIEVQDVSVGYEDKTEKFIALSHASLMLPHGTVCAVIGPSGCGKSTLLRVIAGLQKPLEGKVLIGGHEVNPQEQKIGFIPQNYGLLPWDTVKENILLGCQVRGEMNATVEKRMEAMMKQLGIDGLEQRYPRELSGGQQQRVGLARSFLLNPDVLLMDEPFSALDAITREDMQEVFLQLWRKQAVTTVLVTHYVEEALYLGQRIVLMSAGPGRIAEIMDNPLFGEAQARKSNAFFDMGRVLREKIKEAGADI